ANLQQHTFRTIKLESNEILISNPDKLVVFHELSLITSFNVRDNVIIPLNKKFHKAKRTEQAEYFLQKVQLGKFMEQYPHELSGGMQQREAIARVLAMDPKLRLMEEPLGALNQQPHNEAQRDLA